MDYTDCIKEDKGWECIPDIILLRIFRYLNKSYIPIVALVSKKWHRVSQDNFLWKQYLIQDYHIKRGKTLAPGRTSWLSEYKRLSEEVPMVETECIAEHNNQVLHVSFSHNGDMFATASKDGFAVVWNADYPATVLYHRDMKVYSWQYTQYSEFNSTDSLLLVSGVHFGMSKSTSGEIAVFNLEKGFQLQCRILNRPYDIFGTWFNDDYLLSGDLRWLAQMVSASTIWLNKAQQELQSEREAIIHRLFRFYNVNASSVRTLLVANCLNGECLGDEANYEGPGNPVSSPCTLSPSYVTSGTQLNESYDCSDDDSSSDSFTSDSLKFPPKMTLEQDRDKFLIFTTGEKTYLPHQIGFKGIKDYVIPTVLDVGPDIRERILRRDQERDRRNQGLQMELNWLDYDSVKDKFDSIDHLIDLHGHIVGMCLSPDHRYLYVNCRPWPANYSIESPLQPPTIAKEIDIHVIDMVSFKEVHCLCRPPQCFTPSEECFFIFLDVAHDYVASGAEDNQIYIWERHYEVCLSRLCTHRDVINSVAFNPCDPQMMVSVSDDHKIKIWRSRKRAKQLEIEITKDNLGHEMRQSHKNTKENDWQLRSY